MTVGLQQARDSIGTEPDNFPIPVTMFKELKAYLTVKSKKDNIAGGAVYGNPDYGIYGTSSYTDESSGAFILGNPSAGVLGTSYLGEGNPTEVLVSVKSMNNIFVDRIDSTDFIDTTNSTGTWSSTSYDYTLADGELLQSEIIAKDEIIFTRATLTIEGSNTSDLTLYLSGDGGSTWETVTNGTEYTFTSATTGGIKYKITNTTGGLIFPFTFPVTFTDTSSASVTDIIVRYL